MSRYRPGFDPSILRHSGKAADKAVLNIVHKKSPFNRFQIFIDHFLQADSRGFLGH